MIRLKKKKEAAAAAAAAAAAEAEAASKMDTEEGGAAAGEDGGKDDGAEGREGGDGDKADGSVKLLGIGGRAARDESDGAGGRGKRRTPGEIRIQKDIAELDGGRVAEVSFPNANDLTVFHVAVTPDNGMWRDATYHFTFTIPALYPHEPPRVQCETKIFHPNINMEGNVCLNILREDWKPVLDINAVIYGLIFLFYEPNPDDPLNHEAADILRNDRGQFERIVQNTLRGNSYGGTRFPRLRSS